LETDDVVIIAEFGVLAELGDRIRMGMLRRLEAKGF
jgi:hypothetical protein